MKKICIIIAVILLSIPFNINSVFAQQTLRFATLDDFAPFSWNEGGEAKGIDVYVVKELCQRLNVNCDIVFRPWKRVMAEVQSGESDGGFGAFKTKEREAFAHFLQYPVHYSTFKIFVKKGHEFLFENIEDLYGKTISKNRGFNIGGGFDKAAAEGKILIEEANNAKANILKLKAERMDGYAGNDHETLLMLKQLELTGQVVPLPHSIRELRGAYLIISKAAKINNKTILIQKMDRFLKEMYEDGTIEKINSKYLKQSIYDSK